MQKRVIVTQKMFVVKNLFYLFKVGQKWHLVDNTQTHIMSGITIESQVNEKVFPKIHKHLRSDKLIRFWNKRPNMNAERIWEKTIRIYNEARFYDKNEFTDGVTYPDFTIPPSIVKRLYHFLLKNKVKFYKLKNET